MELPQTSYFALVSFDHMWRLGVSFTQTTSYFVIERFEDVRLPP